MLQVTVTGENPTVTNDNRIWEKNNSQLMPGAKHSFSIDRLTLTITSLEIIDAGEYTFTASNRAGSGTATIILTVQGIVLVSLIP